MDVINLIIYLSIYFFANVNKEDWQTWVNISIPSVWGVMKKFEKYRTSVVFKLIQLLILSTP